MSEATKAPKIANLELNKETIQDLTELETEEVQGGMIGPRICTLEETGCMGSVLR
jgi:hypothetical protein